MEKQPKLAASRASLGSANASLSAQANANLILRMTADHRYRVGQADIGIQAANAELMQTAHDVTQAVVWTYYSVVYAREQLKVAKDAVSFVDFYRDQVEKIINSKEGNREINQITLNRLIARLAEGERLMVKAESGFERRRPACAKRWASIIPIYFNVADELLPDFAKFEIKKEDVIGHARTRRGEVIMAGLFSEASRLEAYAQWSICFRLRVRNVRQRRRHPFPAHTARLEGRRLQAGRPRP